MASGKVLVDRLLSMTMTWNTTYVSDSSSYLLYQSVEDVKYIRGILILSSSVNSGTTLATNLPTAHGLEGRIPIIDSTSTVSSMLRVGTNGSLMSLTALSAGTYYFSGTYT